MLSLEKITISNPNRLPEPAQDTALNDRFLNADMKETLFCLLELMAFCST
jgi:hypothetical protein